MQHLIAAAPGGGKSVLARNLAVRARVPTLYLSADGDEYTVAVSVAAIISGDTIDMVKRKCPTAPAVAEQYDLGELDGYLRWDFTPAPTIEDIRLECLAFQALWGEFPHLIVMDGLRNVSIPGEEYAALRAASEALNILARESGAAVVALHHLTGEWGDLVGCPPMRAIEGKLDKFPGLILNLFRGRLGDVGVAVVKNRFGEADPSGRLNAYFKTDLGKAFLQ